MSKRVPVSLSKEEIEELLWWAKANKESLDGGYNDSSHKLEQRLSEELSTFEDEE
jgi:hypothetical protein